MNLAELSAVLPHTPVPTLRQFVDAINDAMRRFAITTPTERAHFLAHAVHESQGFSRMSENLNYSWSALLTIWPKRFTVDSARMYGRVDGSHAANQQMIANVAYANRMGNGSIESGDGWRYRGRGIGQLTGKDNYRKCGAALGVDLVECPDQLALPPLACASFAWFWSTHGLNALAAAGDVTRIRTIINGGDLGLQECRNLTEVCLAALGAPTGALV